MSKKAGSAPTVESAPLGRETYSPTFESPRVSKPSVSITRNMSCCEHAAGAHGSRGCLGVYEGGESCECQVAS